MKHILLFIGTRPEAVKLAPLITALRARPDDFRTTVCATSQHGEMLQQAMRWFNLKPDEDLQVMRAKQKPADVAATVLSGAGKVIACHKPDMIVVQGDTTTAVAAAMAGFYADIPVAHVEAGLRSGNRRAPWPEETNRVLIGKLATVHFAPTRKNAVTLRNEKADGDIHVVGNTVLDALLFMQERLHKDTTMQTAAADAVTAAGYPITGDKEFILTTGHRRESFGAGLENICRALAQLAKIRPQTDIVYAVHLNPQVRETAQKILGKIPNVFLLPPLDYAAFVFLMNRCRLILTDSGGIQEEAPSLNKPVLVMRETTERPEVLSCGAALLTGTTVDGIVNAANRVLSDDALYQSMVAAKNPFGDGRAAVYIADILAKK